MRLTKKKREALRDLLREIKALPHECLLFVGFMLVVHCSSVMAVVECCTDILCVTLGKQMYALALVWWSEMGTVEPTIEMVAEKVNEELPVVERFVA